MSKFLLQFRTKSSLHLFLCLTQFRLELIYPFLENVQWKRIRIRHDILQLTYLFLYARQIDFPVT
ncbi:hypothetical protein RY27_29060 [Litorilinea aerophila]|nr:hypothetical protein RY27_29060 [Litorilinea aerophila]